MELRSRIKKNEYKELEITLSGLGYFENGMELKEMQQLMVALQTSALDNESVMLERDTQLGRRASELDFVNMQGMHNSTMISPIHLIPEPGQFKHKACNPYERSTFSPFSSPIIPAQQITFQAEVHHEHNWSPFAGRNPINLKRLQYKHKYNEEGYSINEGSNNIKNAKRTCMDDGQGPTEGSNDIKNAKRTCMDDRQVIDLDVTGIGMSRSSDDAVLQDLSIVKFDYDDDNDYQSDPSI